MYFLFPRIESYLYIRKYQSAPNVTEKVLQDEIELWKDLVLNNEADEAILTKKWTPMVGHIS